MSCHVISYVSPVDVSIIPPSPGAAVVVAAAHVVALGVAVPVVGAAHSAPAPSGAQATVGDLCVPINKFVKKAGFFMAAVYLRIM